MILYFFFNDTATTEIYTLSLHDALPISPVRDLLLLLRVLVDQVLQVVVVQRGKIGEGFHSSLSLGGSSGTLAFGRRSEEHTSELQSQSNLVCRLLLEKKKTQLLCIFSSI